MSPAMGTHLLLDVVAADGVRLAREGDELGEALLAEVAALGRQTRWPRVALSETDVVPDLAAVVREPLYEVVFELGHARNWVRLLEGLKVPAPIAEELRRLRSLDAYTYRHALMTTVLTARMLQDLGWAADAVRDGAFSALTHDFGKLRLPLEILLKESPLAEGEARLLRQHPLVGSLLLRYYLRGDTASVRVAHDHHERPDGSGYPARVPLADQLVQVVAINDIFDALVSPRPYRSRPFDVRGALEFLWGEARAGRVDESACRLLISYNRRGKPDPWSLKVSEDVRSPPPEENSYGRVIGE